MQEQPEGKTIGESLTVMTEMIMPNDTNPIGNLMGGNLMRWMDIAGGICALKHCGKYVVTASVDHVSFHKPIKLGSVIRITARVTRAFRSSLEIFLKVEMTNAIGQNLQQSNIAFMTFVAIDSDTQKPVPIPQVIPQTQEEMDLYESAARRRELRLILSGRMEVKDATELKALFDSY